MHPALFFQELWLLCGLPKKKKKTASQEELDQQKLSPVNS